MHPQVTNVVAITRDVYRFCFGPAGALEFINEYSRRTPLERLPYLLRRTQARMSLAENLTWGELHDEDAVGWTF